MWVSRRIRGYLGSDGTKALRARRPTAVPGGGGIGEQDAAGS